MIADVIDRLNMARQELYRRLDDPGRRWTGTKRWNVTRRPTRVMSAVAAIPWAQLLKPDRAAADHEYVHHGLDEGPQFAGLEQEAVPQSRSESFAASAE